MYSVGIVVFPFSLRITRKRRPRFRINITPMLLDTVLRRIVIIVITVIMAILVVIRMIRIRFRV